MDLRAWQGRRRLHAVVVVALVAAVVAALASVLAGSTKSAVMPRGPLSPGDARACAAPSRVSDGKVHLTHFEVWNGGWVRGDATGVLYPHYPRWIFRSNFALAPRKNVHRPILVSAMNCDGTPVRLYESGSNLPVRLTASEPRRDGSRTVKLLRSRLVFSPGDPRAWLVGILYDKPGKAVVRFSVGHDVIDRLTVRVCVANRTGVCRT